MNTKTKITKSEAEWRKELSPEQYHVMREHGTERAWSGKYNEHKGKGIYKCASCGEPLFASETKYESGSGWPSFWAPLNEGAVETTTDKSHGMVRVEVHCAKCDAHLGHVFPDGPKPTGERYCMNSLSLDFEDKEKK